MADCDKAIALSPANAHAYYTRGMALYDLGRHADAIASYDKATALLPHYDEAYYNRALALRELDRYGDAIASYDKAIAANPNHTMAHWNKGLLKLLLGEFEEGWKLFEWRWKKTRCSPRKHQQTFMAWQRIPCRQDHTASP